MIVVVNGASSSGKTTLARELQTTWYEDRQAPLLYFSLDDVISQLPFSFAGFGSSGAQGFPITTDPTSIGVGEHGLRLNELAAQYVQNLAQAGYDLVVDYVFLDQALLDPYLRYCADIPTYFVGMFCAPETLAARNANRDDRADGLAVTQQTQIHFCRDLYDLELDSTDAAPLGLARQVQQDLSDWIPRKGFKKTS